MILIPALLLGLSARGQKSAEDYLRLAPIKLNKEVCAYSKQEFDLFAGRLQAFNDSLLADIEQRKQSAQMAELSPADYQKVMEIMGKVTEYSTEYFGKYYCLTLLCKDYPELLSGEEIARATGYSNTVKEVIQFKLEVISGKAKETDRPGWKREKEEAENGFCSIMGPKYPMVLENDLAGLKRLLPDYHTLGSIYYPGSPEAAEIEALSAVHNYLEKFRTNSFLGNLRIAYEGLTDPSSGF
jgi:hypothetical protein